MRKKIVEIAKEKIAEPDEKIITRAQAIKKARYIAVSAATMMILLSNPYNAAAGSGTAPSNQPAPPPKDTGGIW